MSAARRLDGYDPDRASAVELGSEVCAGALALSRKDETRIRLPSTTRVAYRLARIARRRPRGDDGVTPQNDRARNASTGDLKRGVNGVYHYVSEAHLHRYLSEFDFRYNARTLNDTERTRAALAGTPGKRPKYAT